jgi:hypothetical protein
MVRAVLYTDGKRFVYFDDVSNGLGTLYVGPAGGKAKQVDTDVIIGAVLVRPGAIMYQRQDKKYTVLCLYDGKDVIELAKDDVGMGNWCCSDDGSFVSYVMNKNGKRVGCYRYRERITRWTTTRPSSTSRPTARRPMLRISATIHMATPSKPCTP